MKSSAILTRAAELADSGIGYAYGAISAASKSMPQVEVRPMAYFSKTYGSAVVCTNQQHRVMALLLCAAIAESNGD